MKTKIGIYSFFLTILIVGSAIFRPAYSQVDAGLLPNAVQQFFDNNGKPLSSGYVYTYEAGTSTFKTTWKDSAGAVVNVNPIRLDAGGKAIIYGEGTYRQLVKDRNQNQVWDAVTAPGGGGSSPSLVGDGNLVGTILPWSGLVAPAQYVFAYGQEIVRATYPEYYTAVTQQLNVICSSASNILTGIADTSQIKIGSAIELTLCVAAGTTVTAKTSATVTLSNPSSVSINSVATFFPWGNGNGTTTFNVPDLRGYAPIGRVNMGGASANRITTANCGSGITPDALGAVCGDDDTTLVAGNIPLTSVNFSSSPARLGAAVLVNVGAASSVMNENGTLTATVGSASPTAVSRIQPSLTLNYIAKITPDTSTSIATGVFSIGGMTGTIACGTGILCTGNIISWDGSTLAGGSATNVQYNGGTGVLAGSPNFAFISPDNLTLGAAGQSAKFDIFGLTSGRVRQTVPTVAGTTNIGWGNTSGTPAVTATTPLFISSTTGNINISPDALTRVNDTNVTLTLNSGAQTAVLSPASLTLGWSGQLAVSRGGTGLSSGTSGAIPYFNSTTTIASSALLTANQLMIGGGAGTAPSTIACATTTTVIHGGTPPTCSQIVAGDITTNTITNSNLSQSGAATFKGNPTAATANVQDFTIASLTQTISPSASDFIPIFDNTTGTIKKVNAGSIATVATSGVTSLDGVTGVITVGTGITVSGSTLQINDAWLTLPTTQHFTSGTAQTYTPTSANVRWIEVFVCSAGGGAPGVTNAGAGSLVAGTNGGTTSFNSITAVGGNAASTGSTGGAGGTGGSGTAKQRIPGQAGGNTLGANATLSFPSGFGGNSLCGPGAGSIAGGGTTTGGAAPANTGGGGSGATGGGSSFQAGAGAGAGEYIYLILPATTYTYTVGAKGTGGVGANSTGGAGSDGDILVIEHYGS